ncbi:hypothetical protein [Endozoicomonas sp. 8E]|uniref:hypothetical protein n=1 Tax=Endozoicomonas sp. 8E TaxID=3035692 RepID=UPI00293944FF|nr:hypothetical protein [Endozoicomonas sp. 8E]WOG28348.1 hypothetical protein P6910_01460 [Endozoicomonas sp. 8E]
MKVLLVVPVSIFLSGFASAADVVFRDETVGIGYGFSAKADGFEYSALTHFRKVNGLSVTLDSVEKSGVYIPVNTIIGLQNVNDDVHPTDAKHPMGSVGWSLDSPDVYKPTYTFSVFAGGRFYYPDEQPYLITLSVDGREYGPVKTDSQSSWSPTFFNNVPFAESSRLTIVLSPLPLHPLSSLPEGSVPEGSVPEGSAPEASVPEASVPEASPETLVSEAPVSEAPVSEAPVSEAPVSEAPVSEAPVPEAPVPEAPVPEAPVPEAPVPEAPVPEAPARGAI